MASATNTAESAMALDASGDQPSGNRLFARLPVELMVMVARPLTTPDLCAFRISCKAVEAALFPSFRYEFFRKKQFMVEDDSLQALLAISRNERLASALAHVVIGLNHVNFWYRPATQRDATEARRLACAQHSLLSSGRAVELLAAAFRNLARHGNPKTVDLRDFDSETRWRDGPHAAWRSYGVQKRTSIASNLWRRRLHRSRFGFAASVFVVLLRALAAARVCPASLEVLFRDKLNGLADYALDLTEFVDEPSSSSSVHTVLRGLEKLHLDVSPARDRYSGYFNAFEMVNSNDDANNIPEMYCMNLHAFVAAAKNVRWLRLNFQRGAVDLVDAYMKYFGRPIADLDAILWPQEPDAPSAPPSPDRLLPTAPPFLERLDLGQAIMYPETLLNAVQRLPTLKALHLYVISFQTPPKPAQQGQWPWFLEKLAAATAPAKDGGTAATPLAHLQEFSVTSASQMHENGRIGPAWFDGKEYASHKGPTSRLSDFLRQLSGRVGQPPSSSRMMPVSDGEPDDVDGNAIDMSEDEDEGDDSEND